MKKPAHNRQITEADRAAADRLKALWQAIPKAQRPTQQQLADRWEGPGEANQSLISQYMNGQIALNYRAVLYFAKALGCAPEAIRSDLLEQQADGGQRLAESVNLYRPSQPRRFDPLKVADTITALRIVLSRRRGAAPLNLEEVLDAAMFTEAYAELEAMDGSPEQELAFGAVVAELVTKREGERSATGGKGGTDQQAGGADRTKAGKARASG